MDAQNNGHNYVYNLPAWSLSIELVFYIIAPFILRNFKATAGFFIFGASYLIVTNYLSGHHSWAISYNIYFPSAAFYFGMGALGYWISNTKFRSFLVAPLSYLLLFVAVKYCTPYTTLSCVMLWALGVLSQSLFNLTKSSKIDKLMGDLSYPLYILHIPATIFLRGIQKFDVTVTNYIVCILLFSLIGVFGIERPIDRFRAAWRQKNRARDRVNSDSPAEVTVAKA